MDKSTFGIHQVKLMVKTSPSFSDSSGVGQHANGTLDLGKITSWYNSWGLVVDTNLETSWTPVNKLDGSLGLDCCNCSINILRDNISSVQHAASHVFSMTRVALDHLVAWFETCVGYFSYRQLLVVCLFGGNNWSVGDKREMDTWVRDQVSLEFSKIHIEGTIEAKRGG